VTRRELLLLRVGSDLLMFHHLVFVGTLYYRCSHWPVRIDDQQWQNFVFVCHYSTQKKSHRCLGCMLFSRNVRSFLSVTLKSSFTNAPKPNMSRDPHSLLELPTLGGLNDQQDCLSTTTSIDGLSPSFKFFTAIPITVLIPLLPDGGRISIELRQRKPKLSNLFRPFSRKPDLADTVYERLLQDEATDSSSVTDHVPAPPPPPLNIVIQIVGSRGDVQPFVALGLELKSSFGHRVRIATHAVFRDFVEEHGLEFFNIGGNPEELMAFVSASSRKAFRLTNTSRF
jgi:hypothetical protein